MASEAAVAPHAAQNVRRSSIVSPCMVTSILPKLCDDRFQIFEVCCRLLEQLGRRHVPKALRSLVLRVQRRDTIKANRVEPSAEARISRLTIRHRAVLGLELHLAR